MRDFFFGLQVLIAAKNILFAGAIEGLGGKLCNTEDDEVIVAELVKSTDATIFAFQDTIAAGKERFMIGNTKNGIRRGLLKFIDVNSFPSDAKVECTEIRVYDNKSDEERREVPVPDINVHKVTSDWTTTGKTTLQLRGVNGGVADTGDTTWRYSTYPTKQWRKEGGDFNENVLATKLEAGDLHWYGNTREMADVVQGWINDASTNYGFILVSEVEDEDSMTPGSFARYSGIESSPELIPRLVVTYTSPSQGKPHRNYNDYIPMSTSGGGSSIVGYAVGAVIMAVVLAGAFIWIRLRSKKGSETNAEMETNPTGQDTEGQDIKVVRSNAEIT